MKKKPIGLKINCDICGNPLKKPGALLFSPPKKESPMEVEKHHICVSCYNDVTIFLHGIQ